MDREVVISWPVAIIYQSCSHRRNHGRGGAPPGSYKSAWVEDNEGNTQQTATSAF